MKVDPSKSIDELRQQRYEAAEEVCHTLLIMMQLGLLEIEMESRKFLGDTFAPWSDLHFFMKENFGNDSEH